jgi:hypothetical protein
MYQFIPTNFRTYYTGPNMLEETWDLTFTHVSPDRKHFRYRLCGSRTGPDGEGDSESEFVSKSGRIAISPKDIVPVWDKPGVVWKPSDSVPVALSGPAVLAWSIRPDYRDEVRGTDAQSPDGNSIPFTYVTVADGLPCGRHELTVIPLDGQVFAITAVEVHKPPMAP